jgi:hypothetical protein
MKSLLLFVIILGLYYIFGSPYYYDFVRNLGIEVSERNVVLGTGVVFAAFIILLATFTYNQRENFFFELTPNRPKCSKILSGRPIGFEFTPDADRICYCNQPVKDPSTMGYDGYLAHTVKQDCRTGGCILPGQPTQPQDPTASY